MKRRKKRFPQWPRIGILPDLFIGLVLFLDTDLMRSRKMFAKGVKASDHDGIKDPHYFVCAEINDTNSKWVPISHGKYSTEPIPKEHLGVDPFPDPMDGVAYEWLHTEQRFRIDEAYSFPDLETLKECADSAKNISEKDHTFFITEDFLKNNIIPSNDAALRKV